MTVAQSVGPQGGTVALPGIALEIPPGALEGPTTISIRRTDEQPPYGDEAYSPIFRFEPEGLSFRIPATVRIEHANGAAAPALFWTAKLDPGFFERVDGTDNGATLAAPVDHFSGGFCGAEACRPEASCSLGPSCKTILATCAMTRGARELSRQCTCVNGKYACESDGERPCVLDGASSDTASEDESDSAQPDADASPVVDGGDGGDAGEANDASGVDATDVRVGDAAVVTGSSPAIARCQWSGTIAGEGPGDVVSDSAGNIFVAATGSQGGALYKFDAQCTMRWRFSFGGTSGYVPSLALDSSGNALVALNQAGGKAGAVNAPALVKIDANGQLVWATPIPANCYTDWVAVDGAHNVAVACELLNGAIPSWDDAGTGTRLALMKFDANGALVWGRTYAGDTGGVAAWVAFDASGTLMMGGLFWGALDLGIGNLQLVDAGTSARAFLGRLSWSDGSALWSRSFPNAQLSGMSLDGDGNALMAGLSIDSGVAMNFGTGPIPDGDGFLTKQNAVDGSAVWSKSWAKVYPGARASTASTLAGNVAFATNFGTATDFGGGAVSPGTAPASALAVVTYTPSGVYVADRYVQSPVLGYGIAAHRSGDLVLAGGLCGTLDLGLGAMQNPACTPGNGPTSVLFVTRIVGPF